jgi:hypothetical protein
MFDILSKIHTEGPYRPTIKEVRLWFAIINELIFNGKVPKFKYIFIKHVRGQLGACLPFEGDNRFCNLEIEPEYKDFSVFLAILAHEMVHCYQWVILKRNASHGKYFWKWAKKFKKQKLPLNIRY